MSDAEQLDQDEKMTPKDFSVYLSVAQHDFRNNQSYRMGQAYFNTLFDLHPQIAQYFRNTVNDPFYNDTVLPKFLEVLYNRHVTF